MYIFLRSYLLNIWRQTNPISHNLQLFSHLCVFSLPYLTILVFCLLYFVLISWKIWLNLLMINFNWSTCNFFIGKTRQEVQFQRKIQLKPDRSTGDSWPCKFALCIICICILDLYSLEEETLNRTKFWLLHTLRIKAWRSNSNSNSLIEVPKIKIKNSSSYINLQGIYTPLG